jgi:outer membrane protein assembly factor BamB
VRLLLLGSLLLASLDAQITTSQYDNARTGANIHETVLNPRNVDVKQFGRVVRLPVDGDIYAQPLYLPNLAISGKGTHNVVFVATEHDSVYAFDAAGEPKEPLWKVNFTDAAKQVTTIPFENIGCPFLNPEVGITSTPVIDAQSGTLYVLVRTKEAGRFWQRLHALDVRTGKEKFGGPVIIRAPVETRNKSFFGLGPAQTVDFSRSA